MIFIPVIYFIAKEYFLSWVFLLKYHCFVHLATLGRHLQYSCSLTDTLQQILYTRPLDFVFFFFNVLMNSRLAKTMESPASQLVRRFFWVNINIYLFFSLFFSYASMSRVYNVLLLFVCECVGDEVGVFQNIQFALVSEKFYKLFMIFFD